MVPGADLEKLAAKVVEKNKLIHESKTSHVLQLLVDMYESKFGGAGTRVAPARSQTRAKREEMLAQIQVEAAEAARLEDLDKYVEMLYEDTLEQRVRASALISHLFRVPEHLPVLLDHPALVGALARCVAGPRGSKRAMLCRRVAVPAERHCPRRRFRRVLRDDWMKSIDLEIYIVSSFFAVSLVSAWQTLCHLCCAVENRGRLGPEGRVPRMPCPQWSNFHDRLLEHLVGKITIDIIDLEMKRAAEVGCRVAMLRCE